jgi:hypothetical protein
LHRWIIDGELGVQTTADGLLADLGLSFVTAEQLTAVIGIASGPIIAVALLPIRRPAPSKTIPMCGPKLAWT